MKTSEIYQMACEAIINCETLTTGDKLIVLKELMDRQDTELRLEEYEAKKEVEKLTEGGNDEV